MYTLFIDYLPYLICIGIICTGLYGTINTTNFLKKLMGLGVMQSGAILLFVAFGKVKNGKPPILDCLKFSECISTLSNPLPHVLMLTAIVVGVATLAVGISLIMQINNKYGSIEDDE